MESRRPLYPTSCYVRIRLRIENFVDRHLFAGWRLLASAGGDGEIKLWGVVYGEISLARNVGTRYISPYNMASCSYSSATKASGALKIVQNTIPLR